MQALKGARLLPALPQQEARERLGVRGWEVLDLDLAQEAAPPPLIGELAERQGLHGHRSAGRNLLSLPDDALAAAAVDAHCAGRELGAQRYSDGELAASEFDLDTARVSALAQHFCLKLLAPQHQAITLLLRVRRVAVPVLQENALVRRVQFHL